METILHSTLHIIILVIFAEHSINVVMLLNLHIYESCGRKVTKTQVL